MWLWIAVTSISAARSARISGLTGNSGVGASLAAEGFRHLGYKDDHMLNAAEWIVYDALLGHADRL